MSANAIRQYRRNVIENDEKMASDQMLDFRLDAWFREYRSALEKQGGLTDGPGQAAVPRILHELEADPEL